MSRLTRDGTLPNPSRETKFSGANKARENMSFSCSADHEQDWQPYPVDLYSCYNRYVRTIQSDKDIITIALFVMLLLFKKNLNASKPSEHPPQVEEQECLKVLGGNIGCRDKTSSFCLNKNQKCCFSHSAYWMPTRKKLLYTVANPARGLLNREKRTKEKVWQHTPPPPTHPPTLLVRRKINKITRCIYRRYAGLGRSRVRTGIPSARRLGQWVWLRKILHSRLR